MFDNHSINLEILKQRAYNLRWATLEDGVIPLTAADPDFPSAPEIEEAICAFARDRYYCYAPAEGMKEFKESLADFFIKKRNVPAKPSLVLPVDSAANGIYITCIAFLSKGDEAIIFDPVDFLFRYSVEAIGALPITFPIPTCTSQIDFELLERLITSKTKLLCLCNPLNPTGKVFTRDELIQLGNIAHKHGLIILSDEIWSDIIFQPAVFTSIASLSEEIRSLTITVTGFSKSYGLAGLRAGSIITHSENHFSRLLNASLFQSTIHGVSVLSQVAATAALDKCEYWLKDFLTHLTLMKNYFIPELNKISGFSCVAPDGCYVAFVNISATQKTSKEISELLKYKAKVAVVPGLQEWFGKGAEGYIRMSFATSKQILEEAIFRIKKVMS